MAMPEMTRVESSLIESVGYDEENRKLYVQFHRSPSLYIYDEVSPEVFRSLMTADSSGRFFLKEIKGVYPSTKQEVDD